MKAFTDVEESKKLAEILPIESADMFWADGERPAVWNNKDISLDDTDIPAWSLVSLLSVIPDVSLNAFEDRKWYAMIIHNGKMIYGDKDNPIDACYEMIVKLKEKDLL